MQERQVASTFVSKLMHVLLLSLQQNPPVEAIFCMVVLLSHRCPFTRLPPTTYLAQDVLCPCWLRLLGLLFIRLACLQCQCLCGVIAIQLANKELVARCNLVPFSCDHCWLAFLIVVQPCTFCMTVIVKVACLWSWPSKP
jgi:hypothetical protein